MRKVHSAISYEVPQLSETVLEVHMPASDLEEEGGCSDVIIEPTEDLGDRYSLTMAACLVDGRKSNWGSKSDKFY